jgi:flagellar basal-body rod protein FlgB
VDSITPLVIAKALDGLQARQVATAQNLANANSQGYRPIRVTFEQSLRAAAGQGADAVARVVPHVELAPLAETGGELRLDLEVATASQTAMRYGALLSILDRQMQIARTAIAGGR